MCIYIYNARKTSICINILPPLLGSSPCLAKIDNIKVIDHLMIINKKRNSKSIVRKKESVGSMEAYSFQITKGYSAFLLAKDG